MFENMAFTVFLPQIDNAMLFCDLGAMPVLLQCLNNTEATVRSKAALTLGSALQRSVCLESTLFMKRRFCLLHPLSGRLGSRQQITNVSLFFCLYAYVSSSIRWKILVLTG